MSLYLEQGPNCCHTPPHPTPLPHSPCRFHQMAPGTRGRKTENALHPRHATSTWPAASRSCMARFSARTVTPIWRQPQTPLPMAAPPSPSLQLPRAPLAPTGPLLGASPSPKQHVVHVTCKKQSSWLWTVGRASCCWTLLRSRALTRLLPAPLAC